MTTKARRQRKPVTTEIADLLDVSDVESLLDEMRSWQDNLAGANMEHLPKYEEVENCVSALEEAWPPLEEAVEEIAAEPPARVAVALSTAIPAPPLPRGQSRRARLEGTLVCIRAALD